MTAFKLILPLLCMACIGGNVVAAELADTITAFSKVKSVTITSDKQSGNSEIVVQMDATDYTPAYTYRYSTSVTDGSEADSVSLNLDLPFLRGAGNSSGRSGTFRRKAYYFYGHDVHIGAVVPVAADPGMNCGWEIGISKIAGIGYRLFGGGPALELGLGIVYRSMRLDKGALFNTDNAGRLLVEAKPSGTHSESSRIDMWAFEVPLTLRQKIKSDFYVDLGVEMLLNFSTRAVSKYKSESESGADISVSRSIKHLHQRMVSMDLKLSFGWDYIFGAYIRYSPFGVFRNGFGPKTDFISAGASLAF